MSWEEDGEPKDMDLDQLMAMMDEPKDSSELVSGFVAKNAAGAPPKAPVVSLPTPAQAAKGRKGKKGKAKAINGFGEEEPEQEAPIEPASTAVNDDLPAQLDCGFQSQPRASVNPPPSPYKTRTRTVWIEDEVPTRTGSLETSSIPNPVVEKEKLEKAKKLEEEEREKETTMGGGGIKKGNNNNKKGKKKR